MSYEVSLLGSTCFKVLIHLFVNFGNDPISDYVVGLSNELSLPRKIMNLEVVQKAERNRLRAVP